MRRLIVLLSLFGCGQVPLPQGPDGGPSDPPPSDAAVDVPIGPADAALVGLADTTAGPAPDAPATRADAAPESDGRARSPDLSTSPDESTAVLDGSPVDAPVPADANPIRPPDAAADLILCATAGSASYTGCYIDRGNGYGWARKRGPDECGVCTVTPDQTEVPIWGCYYKLSPVEFFYCAHACGECCYDEEGAPCATASDCCAPLVCLTVGTKKHCQKPL
jgi:hypothetical protein